MSRHAVAMVVTGIVAAMASGCEPSFEDFQFRNATDTTLYFEDETLPVGATVTLKFPFHCVHDVAFHTADRATSATVADEVCAGETGVIEQSDLESTKYGAVVVNRTGAPVYVTFKGDTFLSDQPVEPGGRLMIPLTQAGACWDAPLTAVRSPADGADRTLYWPGKVCDGDEWVIDAAALAIAPAAVSVVNETGLVVALELLDVEWEFTGAAQPSETVLVTLGVAPGSCADGVVMADARAADGGRLQATLKGPLCDGDVLTLDDASFLVWDPATADYVEREPAATP